MLKVSFKTDNAAFHAYEDDCEYLAQESARILRDIAEQIETGADMGTVRDVNGNKIGTYKLTR